MEQSNSRRRANRAKLERKRKELEKRRKMERIVITFFALIIAILPCLVTVVTKINFIPFLVLDVLWFNLILISCIWIN